MHTLKSKIPPSGLGGFGGVDAQVNKRRGGVGDRCGVKTDGAPVELEGANYRFNGNVTNLSIGPS